MSIAPLFRGNQSVDDNSLASHDFAFASCTTTMCARLISAPQADRCCELELQMPRLDANQSRTRGFLFDARQPRRCVSKLLPPFAEAWAPTGGWAIPVPNSPSNERCQAMRPHCRPSRTALASLIDLVAFLRALIGSSHAKAFSKITVSCASV